MRHLCGTFHGDSSQIDFYWIAGMFSFMNAGSGSNQSNHMYKLGPIHQGTMEKGG